MIHTRDIEVQHIATEKHHDLLDMPIAAWYKSVCRRVDVCVGVE